MADPGPERWYSADVRRYVAAAVIVHDGKALLLRRRADDFMGSLWELPSGVVHEGESLEDAITREVAEETALVVRSVGRVLGHFDYRSKRGEPTRQVNVDVAVDVGPIELTEHDEHAWVGRDELDEWATSAEVRDVVAAALTRAAAGDAGRVGDHAT